MPRTLRFHLDENADPRIAAGLRLHGVDISTTLEAGLMEASDEDQLQYAIAERRILITQDTDFLNMAAAGHESPGIVFFHSQTRSVGAVIRGVLLIWEIYDPDEMRNRVEFL